MSDNHKVSPDENVSRVLMRLDQTVCKERPERDEADFLRRKEYGSEKRPENGLSLTRRRISDQEIYDKFCTRKDNKKGITFVDRHLGLTTCAAKDLHDAGMYLHVAATNSEHISLRCNECDKADLADREKVCAPNKEGEECPFFDPLDPLDLVNIFANDVAPKLRKHSKKP